MLELEQGIRVISFGMLCIFSPLIACIFTCSLDGPTMEATGLSELLILEDIAGRWAWDRENDDREGGDIRASEICDMVGGTGLGGFYAILFSLHMTISQVIESHKILQNALFSSEEWERKATSGCSAVLNTALARIIEETGASFDLDGPFLSKNTLKCFICVLNDLNARRARGLRNYRIRTSKPSRCSIREAIHATLADGVHLSPVCIQDEHFISASSGFANPSYELIKECAVLFSKGSKLACFVNLGAGHPGILPLTSGGTEEEQAKLLRDVEAVAQNLVALCSGLGPCYFRLSVTMGVESSFRWLRDESIRLVNSITAGYLGEEAVGACIDDIVDTLAKRHGVVLLERLGSLAAEDGKTKLNAQIEAVHDHVVDMKKAMDKDIFRSVKLWLTPIDQTTKLDACIRTRSSSTCDWLWDHTRIVEWRRHGGIFWLHAGMGTGKTIIMSRIVETLKTLPEECFVAYYYFEFTNPSTLSEEALFRSIVSQLSHYNETISKRLYELHGNGSFQPQLSALHTVLRDITTGAPFPVYIIIDALDELPASQRKYFLDTILKLSLLAEYGLHIMVTSREEIDVHEAFSGKVFLDFAIDHEMVHRDIVTFVDKELAVKKWQSWPQKEVLNMRNILIDKADGMFRVVACQIEVLQQTQTTEDMRLALASLPTTLSDTYLYVLNTIPSHLRTRAQTLLCILSVSFEPVSITELSALLAVELGDPTDPINLPVYREGLRYHEPENIIGLGTALVRRTKGKNNETALQLSHASVKEYLLQDAYHWCSSSDQIAHVATARACLALLIHNENQAQQSRPSDMEYTLSNWWRHISSNYSSQLLSQQMKLFEGFPWIHSAAGKQLMEK
ncbi:hypothetical protein DL96DRAFT_999754 [Flagelloscypha sp. PMI_526]|nr:hypothetical protein DL96DRAFT_999754 [Flagelloscypha sp. PMI_526]